MLSELHSLNLKLYSKQYNKNFVYSPIKFGLEILLSKHFLTQAIPLVSGFIVKQIKLCFGNII
jgi:hypothetical protein